MIIQETLEKIKPFYYFILLFIVASIFFALGRLSILQESHNPIKILYPNNQATSTQTGAAILAVPAGVSNSSDVIPQVTDMGGQVIGVKTSMKYYFPWCGTLKRAKPENQITFASTDLAKAAGYVPGGGCKGLK